MQSNRERRFTVKKDVVFFDLFFTLVTPAYTAARNEYDVVGISRLEWELYAEDEQLYRKRASGLEKNPKKIIDAILSKIASPYSESQSREILALREQRMKQALLCIDAEILDTLAAIKSSGRKLCLISNSDVIDTMFWKSSPLSHLFDHAVFSYEVGSLKPQAEIYQTAMCIMNVKPAQCIYVGDGGSDELKGAKELEIETIMTNYLLKRSEQQANKIKSYADHCVEYFYELKNIIC